MKKQKQQEKVEHGSGFVSVRGFPDTLDLSQDEILKKIEDEYKVCPKCNGVCETVKADPYYTAGVTSFKIHSSPVLMTLKETETLTSNRIKAIVEMITIGRKVCSTCHGLGIVEKAPIKEEKNVTKKRTRKSSK